MVLVGIRHFTHIITCILQLATPEASEYNAQNIVLANHSFAIYNITLSTIFLFLIFSIACKQKWGCYSYVCISNSEWPNIRCFRSQYYSSSLCESLNVCNLGSFIMSKKGQTKCVGYNI